MPEEPRPDEAAPEDPTAEPDDAPRTTSRRGRLGSQLLIAVLLGALGFTLAVQLNRPDATEYEGVRENELVELIKGLDSANERLGNQIDDLTDTRDDLLSSTRRAEDAREQASRRADELAILAGSVPATGPGISMTIDDPEGEVDAALMLGVIEELRDAGAEVIAVNGNVRVVAQTYVLDDEDGDIRIGGRTVKRPYTVEAIGDAATLAAAMQIRQGVVDMVESRGGSVDVEERSSITVTALADTKSPEYASSEP